jgi:polyhydroxyalkanoate synthesis regulator phasin
MSEQTERAPGIGLLRKVMLATIGAAVLAQDEMEVFINRLVERGEMAEKDARKLIQEIIDQRDKMDKERKASHASSSGYATKDDIQKLSARLAELGKQLDSLKKA